MSEGGLNGNETIFLVMNDTANSTKGLSRRFAVSDPWKPGVRAFVYAADPAGAREAARQQVAALRFSKRILAKAA